MQYQINILIDQQSLQQMSMAGENIALVKNVSGNSPYPVVWTSFRPLTNNTVAWTDSYALYGSMAQVKPGVTINMTEESGTTGTGSAYVFTPSSQFYNSGSSAAGTISLANQSSQLSTFGLAQRVTSNGESLSGPTNVIRMNQEMNSSFAPSETVSLFLSQMANSGQILSTIPGNALTVRLSSANPVANVTYNRGTGTFVQQL